MIHSLVLSANLTNEEADIIKLHFDGQKSKWHHKKAGHYATNYYSYYGITHIRIGTYGKTLTFTKPSQPKSFFKKINTLSITINAKHKLILTPTGISEEHIIAHISKLLPEFHRPIQFKLRRLDIAMDITGRYINEYPALLSKGYPIKLRKYKGMGATESSNDNIVRVDAYKDPFKVEINGKSTTIIIEHDSEAASIAKPMAISSHLEASDHLKVLIQLKKPKLYELMRKYKVSSRTLNAFMSENIIEAIEKSMFTYYIRKITGGGTYYSMNYAEYLILASKFNKPRKDKLIALLHFIAKYQGISHFLEHVREQDKNVVCLGRMTTIESYLTDLHKLGINPVTISRRMDAEKLCENKISFKALPNVIDLIDKHYSKTDL